MSSFTPREADELYVLGPQLYEKHGATSALKPWKQRQLLRRKRQTRHPRPLSCASSRRGPRRDARVSSHPSPWTSRKPSRTCRCGTKTGTTRRGLDFPLDVRSSTYRYSIHARRPCHSSDARAKKNDRSSPEKTRVGLHTRRVFYRRARCVDAYARRVLSGGSACARW